MSVGPFPFTGEYVLVSSLTSSSVPVAVDTGSGRLSVQFEGDPFDGGEDNFAIRVYADSWPAGPATASRSRSSTSRSSRRAARGTVVLERVLAVVAPDAVVQRPRYPEPKEVGLLAPEVNAGCEANESTDGRCLVDHAGLRAASWAYCPTRATSGWRRLEWACGVAQRRRYRACCR